MSSSRKPSASQSQEVISEPQKQLRHTQASSFNLSAVSSQQSVLNDDTDLKSPTRTSWWKEVNDNSRDVLEMLESKEMVEDNNVSDGFDVEVLNQKKKNNTLDLPESSYEETIKSILIPQKNLFTQKEKQNQKMFGQIINSREPTDTPDKSPMDQHKEITIVRKKLFSRLSKPRTNAGFPTTLLNSSEDKMVNISKEKKLAAKVKGQAQSLFGGYANMKRKNKFVDLVISDTEQEILEITEIQEIQPKLFRFPKTNKPKLYSSLISQHQYRSSISSIESEMDDWTYLPSSTMVENQLEAVVSPVKLLKMSRLSEDKESETTTITSKTFNKTNKANKSYDTKNRSRNQYDEEAASEINIGSKNTSLNNSRVRRSKSLRENSIKTPSTPKNINKNKVQELNDRENSNVTETVKTMQNIDQSKKQYQNIILDRAGPDNDFTLEYDNDDEVKPEAEAVQNINKDPKYKNASKLNLDVDKVNKNSVVYSQNINENYVEQRQSSNESRIEPLSQNVDNIDINEVCKEKAQNNSHVKTDSSLRKNSNIDEQKPANRSVRDKEVNNSKLLNNTSEKDKKQSAAYDMDKNRSHRNQRNKELNISVNLNETAKKQGSNKGEDQEVENKKKQHGNDNEAIQNTEKEEDANDATLVEENDDDRTDDQNECEKENGYHEHLEAHNEGQNESDEENNDNEQIESHTEKENDGTEEQEDDEETENNGLVSTQNSNATELNDEEMKSDCDEIIKGKSVDKCEEIVSKEKRNKNYDSKYLSSLNVSHDTTERHRKKRETKVKSPEVILHYKINQIDSFVVRGRNTSERKTKSIIFENKSIRESSKFSDGTSNSSLERSGWDSHETTRKTLRQTFGKDFTPRKSLRALVLDKIAKLQTSNYTEIAESRKKSRASSTEYGEDKYDFPSYQEPENVQVEESVELQRIEEKGENYRNEGKDNDESMEIDEDETEQRVQLTAEKSNAAEEDEEVTAELPDEPEEDEDVTPELSVVAEEDEEFAADRLNESEEDEDVRAELSDEAEEDEEVAADKLTEVEKYEVTVDQSEKAEQDGEKTADQSHEMVQIEDVTAEESHHEVSKHTRQTTLEAYVQKTKRDNAERKRKMEEEIRNTFKVPKKDTFKFFKVPLRPVRQTNNVQETEVKQRNSVRTIDMPSELFEDIKYEQHKRFKPSNASWITNRLYKFLDTKLYPKYDYKARVQAENLVQYVYKFTQKLRRYDAPCLEDIEELKRKMARLDVVKTHFEFYHFCHEFLPREIRTKIVPDVVNKISIPRYDVFSNIL